MKENNFKFRESFGRAILPMSDKQAGQLLKGLCGYAFDGKPLITNDCAVKSVFTLIKTVIKQDERDKENGRKGGILSQEKNKERQEKLNLLSDTIMQSIQTKSIIVALSELPLSEDDPPKSNEQAAAKIPKSMNALSEEARQRKASTASLMNTLQTLEELYDSMDELKRSNNEKQKSDDKNIAKT